MGWASSLKRHKHLSMYDAHLTKPVSDALALSLVWSSQRLSNAWANLRARNCLGCHDEHGHVQEGAGNEEEGKRDPDWITALIHYALKPWFGNAYSTVFTKIANVTFHGGGLLKRGNVEQVASIRGGKSWKDSVTSILQLYKLGGLLPPLHWATRKCV